MSKDNNDILFKVTRGPQSGACLRLKSETKYTIGNDPDNDVVLRDVGETFNLLLDTTNGEKYLELKSGVVTTGKHRLRSGKRFPIHSLEDINVGDISFQISGSDLNSVGNSVAASDVSSQDSRLKSGLMLFTVGIILAAGSALAIVSQQPPPEFTEANLPSIESVLTSNDFENVDVHEDDAGQLHISGVLADRNATQNLQKLLANRPETIITSTQTVEQVNETVRELYRINNVTAGVEQATDGKLKVTTNVSDTSLLSRIEQDISAQIPGVGEIQRDNKPPKPIEKQKPVIDLNKQVLMIVAGQTSYVLTRDGARYFEGSVLPDGHRIMQIHKDKLVLKKGENERFMVF